MRQTDAQPNKGDNLRLVTVTTPPNPVPAPPHQSSPPLDTCSPYARPREQAACRGLGVDWPADCRENRVRPRLGRAR
jgi:hypothetical protein